MGAKIQIEVLSDDNCKDILTNLIESLYNNQIKYNEGIHGEYTYWLEGPIWDFGNSNTVRENEKNKYETSDQMVEIIDVLSKHYSPSLVFGMKICSVVVPVSIAIFEVGGTWKEISISFDRETAYDILDEREKAQALIFYESLFTDIVQSFHAHYGLCATELGKFPTTAEEVVIDSERMGDFTFLCDKIASRTDLNEYLQKFKVHKLSNNGIVLTRINRLFEFGL